MRILLATTEAVPFCKTGGLGDVCGSLPRELAKLGHEPVVIMPAFRQALNSGRPIETTGLRFNIPIGRKTVPGTLLRNGRLACSHTHRQQNGEEGRGKREEERP